MDIALLQDFVDKAISVTPPDLVRAVYRDYAPYYHLVHLLAGHMAPCTVVELGVAHGRYLACAAMAGNNNVVIGIDVARYPELDGVLSKYMNITFINKPSVPVPDILTGRVDWSIDILHIDTNHTYNQARGEFDAYKPFLSDGAVVMFDDLHAADDDVLRCFNELPYPKIQDDKLHTALGYGVLVYT